MQWLLQDFEDTRKLADALDQLGIAFTWHKVVPFVGDLSPVPEIKDPGSVVMFGSYTLWRYARARNLRPGVFRIRPFVNETVWHPFLLNGPNSLFVALRDVPKRLKDDGTHWFLRPVQDSKEVPGQVKSSQEIIEMAQKVLKVDESEIPKGSLRPETELMLSLPSRIQKEWRLWVVEDELVTYSLYKEGSRVVYRHEIDQDVLAFGQQLIQCNPGYSQAYVVDVCRTDQGLKMLETNCINAAGFYAADLGKLASAINQLA